MTTLSYPHKSARRLTHGVMAAAGLAVLGMMALPASAQDAAPKSQAEFTMRKTTNTAVKFAVSAFNDGDYMRSALYSEKALEAGLSPKRRAVAYSNLCAALGAAGKLDAALEACDQALTLRPTMSEALNNRGLVRQALSNDVGAKADFAAASDSKG